MRRAVSGSDSPGRNTADTAQTRRPLYGLSSYHFKHHTLTLHPRMPISTLPLPTYWICLTQREHTSSSSLAVTSTRLLKVSPSPMLIFPHLSL